MNSDRIFRQVEIEKEYLNKCCGIEVYGRFHYLIGYFISGFRSEKELETELLPYFDSIYDGTGVINDWNSFPWKGTVCFRFEYIMILDESIYQSGRKLPGLYNQNGEQHLNDAYEWLLDTEFIKNNYSEFAIILIDDFIKICKEWIKVLIQLKS